MSKFVNILICDDDPLLLELVSFRLGLDGYEIATFDNGVDALAALEAHRFDIVILDSMMTGMDGYEVLTNIRQNQKTRDIPVVMLSARSGESDIVDALRNGADDYIVKPFIPDELSIRISKLVQSRTCATDLRPERWTDQSWNFPHAIACAGQEESHEEDEVYGGTGRVFAEAG